MQPRASRCEVVGWREGSLAVRLTAPPVEGAANRDYPLVMGVTILYGSIVILANIVTDVARGLIDPKVSYE